MESSRYIYGLHQWIPDRGRRDAEIWREERHHGSAGSRHARRNARRQLRRQQECVEVRAGSCPERRRHRAGGGGVGAYSCFACRSCSTFGHVSPGAQSFLPMIIAVSGGQSLFPTLPNMAEKCFTYPVSLNPLGGGVLPDELWL